MEDAEDWLSWWCGWAQRLRLPGFVEVARLIRRHWAVIEATNEIIQLAKRRARGFCKGRQGEPKPEPSKMP